MKIIKQKINKFYYLKKKMYSLSVRINAISFFFGICLCVLGAFNIATTIFIKSEPIVNKFNFTSTTLYNNKYTGVQHSSGEFEIDFDFEPTFDWNTNLIFSWISATYISNGKNVTVTLWDRIMKRPDIERHKIKETNLHLRYPLIDRNYDLAGKEIYLELHWEHMPVVGPIIKKSIPLGNFKLRTEKTTPTRSELLNEYDYSS